MRNTKYWISILSAALLSGSTTIAAEWTELFNGKDLADWENPYDWGKAEVVDGEIHLTTEKSKWFLSTVKEYSDFMKYLKRCDVHLYRKFRFKIFGNL